MMAAGTAVRCAKGHVDIVRRKPVTRIDHTSVVVQLLEAMKTMSKIKLLSLALLVPFAAYTAYTMTIAEQSLVSFGYELLSRPDTAQVVMDLYIMAILAIVWMYKDSEDIDRRWLWAVCSALTLVFVSIGPLLYLLLRPGDARPMIRENGSST